LALVVAGAVVAGGVWWLSQPSKPAGPPAIAVEAPVAPPPAPAPAEDTPAGFTLDIPDRLPGGPRPPGTATAPEQAAATPAARETEGTTPGDRMDDAAPREAAQTVVFPGTLDLDPVAANAVEAVRLREHTLEQAFATGAWPGYVAMLGQSLVAATQRRTAEPPQPEEIASLLDQPVFSELLVRHAVLSEIADHAARGTLDAPARRPFFQKLLTDPALCESLLISLTRHDRTDAVLNTWADLWLEHEAARTTHTALALACALVFEKPSSVGWNDQQVRLRAEDRFIWYFQQDEAGRLVGNISEMSATDLTWVVCAPVPESELEWALKKMHLRQSSWGEAYGMVEYDMDRAVKGTNQYDAYTFAEILKKGGICGDRAYFATNTARALGIPAASIAGDGARGPHAWFRWMDRDGTWRMEGRFDGYALGGTTEAQTGQGLSEDWFVQRSERKATAAQAVRQASHRLWLGRVLELAGDARRAGPLYDLAAAANRELPAIAEAQLRHWLAYRAGAPVEEWRGLVSRLKKDFRENTELMTLVQRAETEMIFPRQDGRTVVADLRKDVRQMEKEAERDGAAPKDEDLARTYARQAEVLKKAGDLDAVRALYRRALDDRGNAATFKVLARQYFRLLADTPEAAARACRDLETAWNRHIDNGGDYFDIGSQNSALAVIITCYRETGDTAKADRLQKDLDRRQEKATRRAL
jgi:tetratricopeptide (TPR) repeat protein